MIAALLPVLLVEPLRRAYVNELAIKRARLIRPRLVMMGDSLTAGGAPWGWRVGRDPLAVVTIATGGHMLDQIAMGAEWTVRLHPRYVHILAGTNDILLGAREPAPFVRRYAALIDALRRHGLRVVVTLIPPTADRRANARIALFNAELARMLVRRGVVAIDLRPALAADGVIHPALTTDGIHLSEQGYRVWQRKVAERTRR